MPKLYAGAGLVAAIKLLLHLYAGRHYGYFVDELYYLACADHLAWGYVDQPPLIAVIAKLTRLTLGDSLPAIHLLPAMAGALQGPARRHDRARDGRQDGSRRRSRRSRRWSRRGSWRSINLLSMNAFEPLFWMGCAFLVMRIIRTGNMKLWLWFGVLAGVGLENKHSMLIFGFGSDRRTGADAASGGCYAFALVLDRWRDRVPASSCPNLLWNVQHHFPFLELQENIRRSGRNVGLTPLSFFGAGDPHDAAAERADLDRGTVAVVPEPVSRAGVGVGDRGGVDRGAESARVLSVPGVPAAVRGRRRRFRGMDGAARGCAGSGWRMRR